MLNEAKSLILPATLAVAGVKASAMLGVTNTWAQLGLAIAGAGVGLYIARKVKA